VHQIPRLHLAALPGLRRLSAQRPLHSHLGPVHRRLEGCYWSSPLRAVWGLEHNGGRAHTAHADGPRTNVSRSDRHHQRNQRSRHRAGGERARGAADARRFRRVHPRNETPTVAAEDPTESMSQRHLNTDAARSPTLKSAREVPAEEESAQLLEESPLAALSESLPLGKGAPVPGKALARALWGHLKHCPWLKSHPDQR